jgi:hypothetical protein
MKNNDVNVVFIPSRIPSENHEYHAILSFIANILPYLLLITILFRNCYGIYHTVCLFYRNDIVIFRFYVNSCYTRHLYLLDLVRFGGAPPTDGSREETFRLAESFAERLGRYKMEEGGTDSLDGLLRGAITRKSAETASGTTRK